MAKGVSNGGVVFITNPLGDRPDTVVLKQEGTATGVWQFLTESRLHKGEFSPRLG